MTIREYYHEAYVPVKFVASVETLLGAVFGIAKLPHLRQRLDLLAKNQAVTLLLT
jgi:hypothetical protein